MLMNDKARMTNDEKLQMSAVPRAVRRAAHFRASCFVIFSSFVIRHSSFGQSADPSAPPAIRDIAPPVDVLPWPMWMVWSALAAALAFIGLLAWLAFCWWRNRPVAPPPTPREIALAELEKARAQTGELAPYAFSILVSNILRRYVSSQFQLRATQQTSPEFLAAISDFPKFSEPEKNELAEFLEKCDLIKFAQVAASAEDSITLLNQAVRFVEGGGGELAG